MIKSQAELSGFSGMNQKDAVKQQKAIRKRVMQIKDELTKVCAYNSEISLVEIGRQNLENDIDNEVIPLIDKLLKELK